MIGSDIDRALELSKCAHDFVYFCETYLKVSHYSKGILPLQLHPFQKRYVQVINGSKRFIIGKKFRQGGFTTVATAWMVWKALFCVHQDGKSWKGMYLSKTDREARSVSEVVSRFLELLPSWMQEEIKTEKRNEHNIKFEGRGQLEFHTPTACCGKSMDFLFIDDAAFIEDMDKHWKAMYPTIATGGKVLAMSTTNGTSGWFYDTYQAAYKYQNEFYIFYSYYTEYPEYRDTNWVACTKKNMGPRAFRQEILGQFVGSEDLDQKWMNAAEFACEVSAVEENKFWEDVQEKRDERKRRVNQMKELGEQDNKVFTRPTADLVKEAFGEEDAEQFGTMVHGDEPDYRLENDPDYKGPDLRAKNIAEIKEFMAGFDDPDEKIHAEAEQERQADIKKRGSFKIHGSEYTTVAEYLKNLKERDKMIEGTNGPFEPLPSNRKDATHYKEDVLFKGGKVEQMTWEQIHSTFKQAHAGWNPTSDDHPVFDRQEAPKTCEEWLEFAEMVDDQEWANVLRRRLTSTRKYFKEIEDKVNYYYYCPSLMKLCGLETDGEEYARPDIEILNTVAQDQSLPREMELMFFDGHLCVKGVPTNILERDCMDLYNGTLTLKSSREAKDEVVAILRKKLKVLFGKDLENEHEYEDEVCK